MKSFFIGTEETEGRDSSHAYSNDGTMADHEVQEALTPLLNKWVDLGYSPHELLAIIVRTFAQISSRKIIDFRRERENNKLRRAADHIEEP